MQESIIENYIPVTEWYDGKQQPLYIGPYERLYQMAVHYSWWNGIRWGVLTGTAALAEFYCGTASGWQDLPWRGCSIPRHVPVGE